LNRYLNECLTDWLTSVPTEDLDRYLRDLPTNLLETQRLSLEYRESESPTKNKEPDTGLGLQWETKTFDARIVRPIGSAGGSVLCSLHVAVTLVILQDRLKRRTDAGVICDPLKHLEEDNG
jgi:hypothetical protein